jgi:hypothetical protein
VSELFGCTLVLSRLAANGYARTQDGRKAHVAAWEAEFGPVPEGFELDHLCRRRNCIALHHLEAVTHGENEKRKSWAYRAKRKTCPAGHELSETRVITPEGGIVCRCCNNQQGAAA